MLLVVASVVTALAYVNQAMQPGLTTFLGGSANDRYSQGWPFEHRSLVIQEPDPMTPRVPKVKTKILYSKFDITFLLLNLLIGLALGAAVFFLHTIRNCQTKQVFQFDLTALFFATTIIALLAWQTSINYRLSRDFASWFPECSNESADIQSSLPNLFTFVPITNGVVHGIFDK